VPENNLANNGAGYSFIKQMLSKRYVVEDISDENISTDKYKALVLISPRNVSEDQKKSIDKFIVAGGKIVALLDSVDIGQNLRAEPILTGLEDLFANLGIEIQKNVVADRSNSHAAFAGGYVTYHIPYPFWPKVSKDGFDQNDPSVSQLESLVLPWTASFNVKKELPEGVNVDILAKSTEFSSYQSEGEYNFIPDAASMALQGEGGEQALVVKVQGSLNSYFNKDEKSTSSEIILVGNSRLIRDNFIGQFEENAIFFENIIDHLAMGDTLIGIRSRGATDIPIGDISEVVKGFIKFVNIILPPALLLVFGLVGFFMRKQKKHALQLAFK
ncbi:Gldg family protein, partial [bacterium]|nr:Gldg family protein [bacterium]